MKKYTRINKENRFEIYELKLSGLSARKIAGIIGKHSSTISRELKRNVGQRGYRPDQANTKADTRKRMSKKFIKMTSELIEKIEMMLKDDWSPEQISGVLRKENVCISHERIYQHIWADKKNGGILYKHLRHGHKKRYRKRGAKEKRGQIKNKISIHDRPKIVDDKGRIGDWEIDLVVGKNRKGFIITAVERVSKYTLTAMSEHKDANSILRAVVKLLHPLKAVVHTITSDNGKEFANHEEIATALKSKFFFADAYASWQRGLNENTNGLLRQYFPKKSCFISVSESMLKIVQEKLNNRPRKTLNFFSPFQIFSQECRLREIIC
ncbi:MAG: IS30 family transposase [Candidatus Nitrosomaritimum aestuariumsis]